MEMFSKLLVLACLAALTRGDHFVEDILADEPHSREPVVDVEFANSTFDQRATGGGSKYGAHVERVSLGRCPNYYKYKAHFYEGLVVNSRAWKTKGNERFTAAALTDTINKISSSSGAVPSIYDNLFHSWEMLDMNMVSQDIRQSVPNKIYYWTWNAMQQIYIPLYMFDEANGGAYMLHIYPEIEFLKNPPADTTFTDGLVWAKGNNNRMYKLEIDIAGMIRNLKNFSVPDYQKYVWSWGVALTGIGSTQSAVAFPDYRQISLRGSTIHGSTERICGDLNNSLNISWAEMQLILQQQFSWL